jgi:hypothetical protein
LVLEGMGEAIGSIVPAAECAHHGEWHPSRQPPSRVILW